MGFKRFAQDVGRGLAKAKSWAGNALHHGVKWASQFDKHIGTAKRTIGALAPAAGAIAGLAGGPFGSAVGGAVGSAVSPLTKGMGN